MPSEEVFDELDTLIEKRAQLLAQVNGAERIEFKDRAVTYRNPEDIMRAVRRLDAEIARARGGSRQRVFYPIANRGL